MHDFAKSIISYLKHTSHFFNNSILNSPQTFITREGWSKKVLLSFSSWSTWWFKVCFFALSDNRFLISWNFFYGCSMDANLECSLWSLYVRIYIVVMTQYNNSNSFQSQTSWGRLELKPIISRHGSGTWIANFHAPLSTPKQEKSTTEIWCTGDHWSKKKSTGVLVPDCSHNISLPLLQVISCNIVYDAWLFNTWIDKRVLACHVVR